MAAEALLRPQSAGTAVLVSGGAESQGSGRIGVDGTYIFLKVQSAQFNLSQSVIDTTGDGDSFATYDHNNELRGQISFRGFMIADNHIGIESLVNPTAGSTADKNPFQVTFTPGVGSATRKYKFKMMVSNVVIDWNRVAGLIGVAIQGQLTGNVDSTYAFSEE
jgi:hypothetical protein